MIYANFIKEYHNPKILNNKTFIYGKFNHQT